MNRLDNSRPRAARAERGRITLIFPLIFLLFPGTVLSQDSGPIRGDPANARPDPRAIGALGGEGIPVEGEAARERGFRPPGIEIVTLVPRGAGSEAGLRVGDVIVGIGKRSLAGKRSPFLELAALLESPRKAGVPAEVKVRRERETVKVPVLIPGTAKHPKKCPTDCSRCESILVMALAHLAELQAPDGSLPTKLGGTNGQTAVTTIAGLAFLAAGSTPTIGPYAKNVRLCREWLIANAGHERDGMTAASGKNWSQVNWALGYAPLFLARVQAIDPTDENLAKLEWIRDEIQKNMEPTGGWAHGPRSEYPYPLDYAELTATGNICLAALGEIRSLGISVETKTIAKAISYIDESSDGGGGVGYSTRTGQVGMGSAGRSASALLAMHRLGMMKKPFAKKLASYIRRNLAEIPEGHVSPDFHLFFGALACRALGKKDWKSFMDAFRLEFLSLHNGDGTFGVRPADTSRFGMPNTDRSMGEAWRTATFAMILALAGGRLDEPAGATGGPDGR